MSSLVSGGQSLCFARRKGSSPPGRADARPGEPLPVAIKADAHAAVQDWRVSARRRPIRPRPSPAGIQRGKRMAGPSAAPDPRRLARSRNRSPIAPAAARLGDLDFGVEAQSNAASAAGMALTTLPPACDAWI